ncbi:MAG: Lrp/AsnC family transcriptional regulator [Actinomycetota bacterium]|nr:Lrp/AsnC family transcriptional regulator [Actinomycetota bacterium]
MPPGQTDDPDDGDPGDDGDQAADDELAIEAPPGPRHDDGAVVDLDDTDKAIIRALQVDGRMSYSSLGPEVGLSRAAVRQRVQRLIDHGVMEIVAVTDPARLGFALQAMVAVSVRGDTRAVAKTLSEWDEIDYLVLVAGRYDLLLEVVCADVADLVELVNGRIRAIPEVVSTEIFTYLQLVKQTYSWGTP